ncbi:restriction endonuclease subunit S [Desulfovibrio sp. ZJ200]|uniref:restriction endonuclease subunit S n=1 Tax=Desulfovibrio sp. ZJ200 TaxID=2709792 RepID=UPI0013EB7016|nr:restriction endonuclease subunit S [Desulfovibrio sp. ZJ200]
MNSVWRNLYWGDIVSLEYGKALRADQRKYGDYPVYGTNGQIGKCNTVLCNEAGIIIGRKGEYREVHYSSIPFFVIDTAFYIKKKENFDVKWAYYYLKTQDINELDSGSAIPSTSREDFYQLPVSVPPLQEQHAIAAVLSSLDDKIDLLNRQNVTLEAMAEALFRQWFAITSGERNNKTKIGDLFDISSGKGLKKEAFLENGTYPILGANGKIGTTNEFLYDEKIIYTGRVGTLGNIFTFFEKAWYSDNTLVFTEIKYFYFTYFLLKFLHLEDYNVGSTQPLIRQSDIKNIEIFLPHKIRIEKFEGIAENIFAKIRSNQTQIITLEKLRDTLLPKLMSGEVRVTY